MKKSLLFIFFISIGGIYIFGTKNSEIRDEHPFSRVKNKTVGEQKIMAEPVVAEEQVETASLESLEENYQDLEIKDLQKALDRVDKSREKLQLIEAFNNRKLTELESKELTLIIRTRIVLTKLVMEKKFEELEHL